MNTESSLESFVVTLVTATGPTLVVLFRHFREFITEILTIFKANRPKDRRTERLQPTRYGRVSTEARCDVNLVVEKMAIVAPEDLGEAIRQGESQRRVISVKCVSISAEGWLTVLECYRNTQGHTV